MDQEVQNIESKLSTDRNVFFRGTAKIKLQHLRFVHVHDQKRDDSKLIEELEGKFKERGCRRLEPKNHIPAIIDQTTLDDAIRISNGVNAKTLLENPKKGPPELKFDANFSIECLDGRLRAEAGKTVLSQEDRWWAVDLYLKG